MSNWDQQQGGGFPSRNSGYDDPFTDRPTQPPQPRINFTEQSRPQRGYVSGTPVGLSDGPAPYASTASLPHNEERDAGYHHDDDDEHLPLTGGAPGYAGSYPP